MIKTLIGSLSAAKSGRTRINTARALAQNVRRVIGCSLLSDETTVACYNHSVSTLRQAFGSVKRERSFLWKDMQEAHDPYAALRSRDYRRLLLGNVLASAASEMQS